MILDYRAEQYDPDLSLYYLRARYYNPATGRFLSRDPEDGKAKDPKTLHKYLYASGDPVNRLDSSGRAATEGYGVSEEVDLKITEGVSRTVEKVICGIGLEELIRNALADDAKGFFIALGPTLWGCFRSLYD